MKAIVVKWLGKVRLFSLVSSKLADCSAKSVCPPLTLKLAGKFFQNNNLLFTRGISILWNVDKNIDGRRSVHISSLFLIGYVLIIVMDKIYLK